MLKNSFFEDKRNIKLIILLIVAVVGFFIGGSSVFASTDYAWSDTKYTMTIEDLYNLMDKYGYNTDGEDFSTYSYSVDTTLGSSTTVAFNYSNLLSQLQRTNNTVLFTRANYGGGNKFVMLSVFTNQPGFDYSSRDNLGYYYRIESNYVYAFIFDLDNNTVICAYQPFNKPILWQSLNLGTLSWFYNTSSGMDLNYFGSSAYQQDLLFDSFYLVNGAFYDFNRSFVLNKKNSYKVTESTYNGETYSGSISYSIDFGSWLTDDLSDTFLTGEYSYYLEQYMYSSSGFDKGAITRVKLSDVTFSQNSIFLPPKETIDNAIKSFKNYDMYGYVITLCPRESYNIFLLSSDLIILNADPIGVIPYFIFKYDYIYYTLNASNVDGNDPYYNYDFGQYFMKPYIRIENVQGLVQETSTIPFSIYSQSGDEYYPFNMLKMDLRVYKITESSTGKYSTLVDTYKRYNGDYVDTTNYLEVNEQGVMLKYKYNLTDKFDSNFINQYVNSEETSRRLCFPTCFI